MRRFSITLVSRLVLNLRAQRLRSSGTSIEHRIGERRFQAGLPVARPPMTAAERPRSCCWIKQIDRGNCACGSVRRSLMLRSPAGTPDNNTKTPSHKHSVKGGVLRYKKTKNYFRTVTGVTSSYMATLRSSRGRFARSL